jgi:hypothetical protein
LSLLNSTVASTWSTSGHVQTLEPAVPEKFERFSLSHDGVKEDFYEILGNNSLKEDNWLMLFGPCLVFIGDYL